MNPITVVMVCFSMIAALDRVFGGKLGMAKEFERGIMMLGNICLSMTGMIVISPFIADILQPAFGFVSDVLHIDPSIIPASLFANDMGGAPLSKEIALNADIGMFNALVVSAMMGCTVSFTIPVALGMVEKEQHKELLLGLLCGIVTIPLGCFVSGLVLKLPMGALLVNLLPLVVFSVVIALGLVFCPDLCVKIFGVFGTFIKILITVGLALGILKYLTGIELIKGLETFEAGGLICLNACAVMTGAFPLMYVLGKLLKKPMALLGKRMKVNETSVMGLLSSLATSMTTFGMMKDMDKKGVLMNSAFAVSGAFTFAGHLAFTMAFDANYIFPVIIGKLVAGVLALLVAMVLSKRYGETAKA
ncbi:MAG: ethanolamine utilization protein EutH [Clostridia bacterium]|nr:ethanolamine utilization protein EutH [Clostridia bacterium]